MRTGNARIIRIFNDTVHRVYVYTRCSKHRVDGVVQIASNHLSRL